MRKNDALDLRRSSGHYNCFDDQLGNSNEGSGVGASANEASGGETTFVANDYLSELVWSPRRGLILRSSVGINAPFSRVATEINYDKLEEERNFVPPAEIFKDDLQNCTSGLGRGSGIEDERPRSFLPKSNDHFFNARSHGLMQGNIPDRKVSNFVGQSENTAPKATQRDNLKNTFLKENGECKMAPLHKLECVHENELKTSGKLATQEGDDVCDSVGPIPSGTKRVLSFDEQLSIGSKRLKNETPASNSMIKSNGSFTNWISTMTAKHNIVSNEQDPVGNEQCVYNPSRLAHNILPDVSDVEASVIIKKTEGENANEIVDSQRCKSSDTMASLFAKRLDALKLIMPTKFADERTSSATTSSKTKNILEEDDDRNLGLLDRSVLIRKVSHPCKSLASNALDMPIGIFEAVKSLQLYRADITKWMNSMFSTSLDGYYLRLRIGKLAECLGRSSYHVACICGEQVAKLAETSRRPLFVIIGGMRCSVQSQFISNQDFLEDELKEWWSSSVRGETKIPSEDELKAKVEERKRLGL